MSETKAKKKKKQDTGDESDGSIRAISRGLSVLKVINRMGSSSLTEISRETAIPYPTVCRIISTLLQEEMIEREPNRKRYRPTMMVRSLAMGYQLDSRLVSVANPRISDLCRDIVWPISLATRVGSCMVLLDSTHRMTSLTLSHYYPGHTLPISECSTGKVYLAHCDPETRQQILENMATIEFGGHGRIDPANYNEEFWEGIRKSGYAVQPNNVFTADPGKTASIAAPIIMGGSVVASIAVIFFKNSLKLPQAEEQFVDKLKATAREIERHLEISD